MKCIFCDGLNSKVIDSRTNEDGTVIRRRRECLKCGKRFTTYETIEHTPVMVIKNDGTRQAFNVEKLKNGILKSCEKRPVSIHSINKLVTDIEKKVYNSLELEITSKKVGELVMDGLKNIDEVSYVRFASVHRQFKDINTFLTEIEELIGEKDNSIREKYLKNKKKK